jgi:galactokinase
MNADVVERFERHFGKRPQAVAFAPGRVNLIGEHTDYNDGFVLPIAVQMGVSCAGSLDPDDLVEAASSQFPDDPASFPEVAGSGLRGWHRYLSAILTELAEAGIEAGGLRLFFASDLPLEAGLSSSAAFSVCTAILVSGLLGREWDDKITLARLCQRAENRTGVMCGLLDQMASAACVAGHAMLLDCRDLTYQMVPLPSDAAILVGDTGIKRALSDSRYNERRSECARVAEMCGVESLRDLTSADLAARQASLPDTLYRRTRHVVSENERVIRFASAIRGADLALAGQLLIESHRSLRDDYEVSCPELDGMVESFMQAGALGARMVGAGFGGSAIALAERTKSGHVLAAAGDLYRRTGGIPGNFYTVEAGDGARMEDTAQPAIGGPDGDHRVPEGL